MHAASVVKMVSGTNGPTASGGTEYQRLRSLCAPAFSERNLNEVVLPYLVAAMQRCDVLGLKAHVRIKPAMSNFLCLMSGDEQVIGIGSDCSASPTGTYLHAGQSKPCQPLRIETCHIFHVTGRLQVA